MSDLSFIETQFPVSKVSKESYKERKAGKSQTITGLGRWWGRKPLVLVRAALLGCLLPSTEQPKKDMEIFLKLMGMDEEGLQLRKEKKFSPSELYRIICSHRGLNVKYAKHFTEIDGKVKISRDAPREDMEKAAFQTLGYDEKIEMGKRPEQLDNISEEAWKAINAHVGTNARSLQEFVQELSIKRFGHVVTVGDCFCGGGSIPFEAARMGFQAHASDLNPVAGLLTWADINISGSSKEELSRLLVAREDIYRKVESKIQELGIEENEHGDRAQYYIYCCEAVCPECGTVVPLSPSWVIGHGSKTVVKLVKRGNTYDFEVKMGASSQEMNEAAIGTFRNQCMICPCCGKTTPSSTLRHDVQTDQGISYGLRLWEQSEFMPRAEDVYHERLYAIKYVRKDGTRHYRSPQERDLENEAKVLEIVSKHFAEWQEKGVIPTMAIEEGPKTVELTRSRGWRYWHQLFNPRQILILSLLSSEIMQMSEKKEKAAALLGLHKCVDWNSKICRWHAGREEKIEQTYYNQALNTLMNYGARSLAGLKTVWHYDINRCDLPFSTQVALCDARDVDWQADLWLTDPPYADAVNYHELSEFFLAWDKSLIKGVFPNWYTDSKRILAVRGDEHFAHTMIEIYSNLAHHMPEHGIQIVMFTHSDPAVWAQLAVIMWKAGLQVTAAWNIATETDASGLKDGNYIRGTVLLVLRKQRGTDVAFLDEINADIRAEVRRQIASMQELDDKEEPNFADPDYVLAAYAASLKVLTAYATIEDLNLDYELNQAIKSPAESQIVDIIEEAKQIAYDCVIPAAFESYQWREMSYVEKFYIKGLESEKRGNYQISTYQEFAKGFAIGGYSQLMAKEKANSARLKTPCEMASRTFGDVSDFEHTLMRTLFEGIYVGVKAENPNKALGFIKSELADYWGKREMIQRILAFLVDIQNISNMQPHWTESAKMAELLLTLVTQDSI